MKTYVDFKLLNMEKTYFVIKPLKNDPLPPEATVSIFFLEIEIVTTKIVNSKSLKNLSSASVGDERL